MDWVTLVQIGVAAALGATVGLERELGTQPAGLRTHMLVSIGAALFTLAGTEFLRGGDPTRVAAQVVTGVGFLGGGAILREGATVRGLTTAASLWVTAAIGLAVGLRLWLAAVATTIGAVAVLWPTKYLEREILPQRRALEATLTLEPGAALDQVEAAAHRALPRSKVLRVIDSDAGQALVIASEPMRDVPLSNLAERLRTIPGVRGIELSR